LGSVNNGKISGGILMLRLANIVTILLTLLISAAPAQERRDRGAIFELVLFGEREVDLQLESDTIDISFDAAWYRDRSFRALQFYAARNDIEMRYLTITYINGFSEDVRVDRTITRNGQIQVDLEGGRSFIRRIEMYYRARPGSGRQALIRVYGEPARVAGPGPGDSQNPPAPNEWVRLGCGEAKFFNYNRPVQFTVRQPGRYHTIRITILGPRGQSTSGLFARGLSVEVFRASVIFINGVSEDIIDRPRTLDVNRSVEERLKALEHFVNQIEFRARTILNDGLPPAGSDIPLGRVCASGLPLQR